MSMSGIMSAEAAVSHLPIISVVEPDKNNGKFLSPFGGSNFSVEYLFGPQEGEDAVFNPTIINFRGQLLYLARINLDPYIEGIPDRTTKLGLYTSFPGITKRVKELDLLRFTGKGIVSIEDPRSGPACGNCGSALLGFTAVRHEGQNRFIPYPAVAPIHNLEDLENVRLGDLKVLYELGAGKNTLPLVCACDKDIKLMFRPEGKQFNHTLRNVNISDDQSSFTDEQIPKQIWCQERFGLTGPPIDLPITSQDIVAQKLYLLHGSSRLHIDSTRFRDIYQFGLGIRTEYIRDERIIGQNPQVSWNTSEKGLFLKDGLLQALAQQGIMLSERNPYKSVMYSSGVALENSKLVFAVSIGDRGGIKLTQEAVAQEQELALAA